MKLNIFILTLLFLTQFCNSSFAQIELSQFDNISHYDQADGLSSTHINGVKEDKSGFMWLATQNGISRFDGSYFTNFEYYDKGSVAHKIAAVHTLFLDDINNMLWIGGVNGIFYTSLVNIEIKKYQHWPTAQITFPHVNSFFRDKKNKLWVCSKNGLLNINLNDLAQEPFVFKENSNSGDRFYDKITNIRSDPSDDQILWFGTLSGLIRFNTVTSNYERIIYKNDPKLAQNRIRTMYVTATQIFAGTWGRGLVIYDKQVGKLGTSLNTSIPISDGHVLDIYDDGIESLWITTNNELFQYDYSREEVVQVIDHNLSQEIIRGVSMVDSRGLIWFGDGRGLFKYSPQDLQFKYFTLEKRSKFEIPMSTEQIIVMNGMYYIVGQGSLHIYKINPAEDTIEIIDIPQFAGENQKGSSITDMVEMEDGNLLLLSRHGLVVFDTKTQKTKLSPLQLENSSLSIQSLVKDNNGNYWIGSRVGGLHCLNYNNMTVTNYKEEFNEFNEGEIPWINNLYIDSKNKLWIGRGSFTVMDLDDLSIHNQNKKAVAKYYQDAHGFQEDSKGRVWVAGGTKGLGYTNFKNFQKGIEHKIDRDIFNVYERNDSILWTLGKNLGELNINTLDYTEIKFSSTYNSLKLRGPIVENDNGEYLIGCENGIFIYNPEYRHIIQEKPQPYIREIYRNGKLFYQNQSLTNIDFTFKSGTSHISVGVSALGFDLAKEISYKYRIENDWLDVGPSHKINFANLNQGTYNIEIRAIDYKDEQTETPIEFNFTILGPWYKSFWAFAFYSAMLLSILLLLYRFNLRRRLAVAETSKIKEIEELKSKMYANISHEFRTPLTIISGLSDELLEGNENDNQVNLLKGISYSNKQLLNLVNQMLDLSSLDAKKMVPSYKNGDIVIFIEKCVSIFKSYTDSKQQSLNFKSDVANLTMDFDDDKLQKILNNLLSNAIKFTPEQGEINVQLKQIKDQLRIIVSDTGIGIEKKEFSQVFERYYKTYDLKQNIGTGIGLALTQELVKLLQGKISIDSKVGIGTTFRVDLPIQNTSLKVDAIHKIPFIVNDDTHVSQIENSSTEKKSQTILLVEDNEEIRNFIKLILGDLYTIHTANNGVQGLKIARNKTVDFIISDVMMPEMNGFEFCEHIKKDINTSHIPFVIISARTETKDKVEAYKLGVDAYLFKPFNKQELLLIIKNLLEKKQQQISFLSNLLHLRNNHTDAPDINELDLNLIKNIQEVALDNDQQMSVDELAQYLYTSRSQLHKKVKSLTGMSITNYMNHIRIEKAKDLLKTTQLTISEIAYEVGFTSSNYFARSFKKLTNTSPVSYRQSHS